MWSLPKARFLQGNWIISHKEAGRGDRRIFKTQHRQHQMPNEQQVRVSQRYETAPGWTVSCQERFHTRINCTGCHRTPLLELTPWISCHRKQAESTLTNKTHYAISLTIRLVCLGFCIYFMKKSSTSSANRAARLMRTSLPQYPEYQHFPVQQNSEAIHEVLSQNRTEHWAYKTTTTLFQWTSCI